MELDGIASKEGVIMLASTNSADVLDKALLRPGTVKSAVVVEWLKCQTSEVKLEGWIWVDYKHEFEAIISLKILQGSFRLLLMRL